MQNRAAPDWKIRAYMQLEHICSVLLIVTALKKVGVFASFFKIYYEMIEDRTIAHNSDNIKMR